MPSWRIKDERPQRKSSVRLSSVPTVTRNPVATQESPIVQSNLIISVWIISESPLPSYKKRYHRLSTVVILTKVTRARKYGASSYLGTLRQSHKHTLTDTARQIAAVASTFACDVVAKLLQVVKLYDDALSPLDNVMVKLSSRHVPRDHLNHLTLIRLKSRTLDRKSAMNSCGHVVEAYRVVSPTPGASPFHLWPCDLHGLWRTPFNRSPDIRSANTRYHTSRATGIRG